MTLTQIHTMPRFRPMDVSHQRGTLRYPLRIVSVTRKNGVLGRKPPHMGQDPDSRANPKHRRLWLSGGGVDAHGKQPLATGRAGTSMHAHGAFNYFTK